MNDLTHSALHAEFLRLLIREGSDRDHEERVAALVLRVQAEDLGRCLVAVHHGHLDVHEDQSVVPTRYRACREVAHAARTFLVDAFLEEIDRLETVHRLVDREPVAELIQNELQGDQVEHVIVYDHHCRLYVAFLGLSSRFQA